MQAPELVQKLRDYMETSCGYTKRDIAERLATYIEQEICTGSEKNDAWRKIDEYLPIIANRVISEMREDLKGTGQFTEEGEMFGYFDAKPDRSLVQDLKYVLEDAVSVEASRWIDVLVSAELHLLHATFDRFLQKVYVNGGLRDHMQTKPEHVQKTFGDVKFGCGIEDDRIVIWFWDKTEIRGGNVVFSFPVDDTQGLHAYLRSCYCTYTIARENVEQVIAKWPTRVNSPS